MNKNPKALDKLEFLKGDIGELGLGLSVLDKQKLENVSVVFHSAAVIRFDEPLKVRFNASKYIGDGL